MPHVDSLMPDTKRKRFQRGQALAEFAMIFPIVLFVGFGGAEFGFLLQRVANIDTYSREAANTAVRACSEEPPANVSACIQGVANFIRNRILVEYPDFNTLGNVIVSRYEWQNNAVTRTALGQAGNAAYSTRYTTASFIFENVNLVQEHSVLVVGEVYYNPPFVTPVAGFFQYFSQTFNLPGALYGTTVL